MGACYALAGEYALSSSFVAQAAVPLHLVANARAGIQVIPIDKDTRFFGLARECGLHG